MQRISMFIVNATADACTRRNVDGRVSLYMRSPSVSSTRSCRRKCVAGVAVKPQKTIIWANAVDELPDVAGGRRAAAAAVARRRSHIVGRGEREREQVSLVEGRILEGVRRVAGGRGALHHVPVMEALEGEWQ